MRDLPTIVLEEYKQLLLAYKARNNTEALHSLRQSIVEQRSQCRKNGLSHDFLWKLEKDAGVADDMPLCVLLGFRAEEDKQMELPL